VDLFSRKAKFHDVVKKEEALVYHAVKYQSGNRYPLAVMCFQHLQHKAQVKK
jgi:hypothetical protein